MEALRPLYPWVLSGLFLWGVSRGSREQAGVALVLVLNWLACVGLEAIGLGEAPVALFAVDVATIVPLALFSASVPPLVICGVLVVQLIAHMAAQLVGPAPWPTYYYESALAILAWAQSLLLGGWMSGVGDRISRRWNARGDALAGDLAGHPLERQKDSR